VQEDWEVFGPRRIREPEPTSRVAANISMLHDKELFQRIETIIQRKIPQIQSMLCLPPAAILDAGECKPMEEAVEHKEETSYSGWHLLPPSFLIRQ
jgi:hypothetical protein